MAAGKRITELNSMTGAQVDPVADVLAIVDVDGQETKKISIDEIALAIGSGAVNVSLNLTNNLLELTDSNNNTVSADLSSLDNSGLTLQDVTSNGAVTSDDITINSLSGVSTGQLLIKRNNFSLVATNGSGNNGSLVFYTNNAATYAAGINTLADNEWVVTKGSFAGASNQLFKIGEQHATFTGNSHIQLTSGTTAERPTTPANGMIRYNSQDDVFEGYDGEWGSFVQFSEVFNSGQKDAIVGPFDSEQMIKLSSAATLLRRSSTSFIRLFDGYIAIEAEKLSVGGAPPTVTLDIQGTDAVQLTSGTTAERPTTPANGMIRYNSQDDVFEGYDGEWGKMYMHKSGELEFTENTTIFRRKTVSTGTTWESSKDFRFSSTFMNINVSNGLALGSSTFAPTVTLDINGTDAVQLTSGTTAERPTTPANGMIRYNSEDDVFEGYAGGNWGEIFAGGNGLNRLTVNSSSSTIIEAKLNSNFLFKIDSSGGRGSSVFASSGSYVWATGINSNNDFCITNGASANASAQYFKVKTNGIVHFPSNNAVQLTSGTTAQRPTGNAGMIRFNTDTSKFEGFDGTTWIDLN